MARRPRGSPRRRQQGAPLRRAPGGRRRRRAQSSRSAHRETLAMARGRPAIERLWQPGLPAQWWPLWAALTPAAALYGGALALRMRWWRGHAAHAATAIISVGNLTIG